MGLADRLTGPGTPEGVPVQPAVDVENVRRKKSAYVQ
jgi:hypothetical protein